MALVCVACERPMEPVLPVTVVLWCVLEWGVCGVGYGGMSCMGACMECEWGMHRVCMRYRLCAVWCQVRDM